MTILVGLLMLCLLIWLPILLYQISNRGFSLFLLWLLVAPVATNLYKGRSNPFFSVRQVESEIRVRRPGYVTGAGYAKVATDIRLQELLEPSRLLLTAFFAVFLLNALVYKNRLISLDTTELWMAVFSVILVVNVLLYSRRVAFGLKTAIDALLIPFMGYYITRRYVTNEDRFCQLTKVIGYMGLYVIISCLIERLMNTQMLYRLKGPFAGAPQLHMVLIAILYVIFAGSKALPPHLYRFLLYLIPVVTLLLWSRGYWLSFLAGIWTFLFLGRRFIDYSRKLLGIGLTLLLAAIIALGALAAQGPLEERVANTRTVEWRFVKWQIAIEESIKHPIFGIGLNNLRDVYGETAGGYTTAHNSHLSFLGELGALGLLAYLAIMMSIIRMGLHVSRTGAHASDRWRGVAVIAAIIAYQAAAGTITLLYTAELSHLYIYVFAGAIAGLYGARCSNAIPAMSLENPQPMSPEMSLATRT